MRLRFDQLGKQIGREALAPAGTTVVHEEIAPDAQHVDLRHEPDPAREAERARLGLLGKLAAVSCLIELYGHAPDEVEVLACIGKLVGYRLKRARIVRQKRPDTPADPFLWIIAAGRPDAVLATMGATAAPGFPPGVYFGPEMLRLGFVVASELPRERSTLLVRLMAAGPLLGRAMDDLDALPAHAHERAISEPILLRLRHVLEQSPNRSREEEDFIMSAIRFFADRFREVRAEGLREGRTEGRAEEAARAVLTALRVRGITVPDGARARILAEKDPERLERWHERAIVASTLAEVLDEPS
jgi:hypothetical protein